MFGTSSNSARLPQNLNKEHVSSTIAALEQLQRDINNNKSKQDGLLGNASLKTSVVNNFKTPELGVQAMADSVNYLNLVP